MRKHCLFSIVFFASSCSLVSSFVDNESKEIRPTIYTTFSSISTFNIATPSNISTPNIATPSNISTAALPSYAPINPDDNSTSAAGIVASLESDQQALQRMTMILSLVGGLGVVAIVTTVVIFTRMRARNKKQRALMQDDSPDSSLNHSTILDPPPVEPSAPPETVEELLCPSEPSLAAIPSSPPSAPTAKELSDNGHDDTHPGCTQCTPSLMMTPELPLLPPPPPAYTPSAPPHYAIGTTSSPPTRRHSLGA